MQLGQCVILFKFWYITLNRNSAVMCSHSKGRALQFCIGLSSTSVWVFSSYILSANKNIIGQLSLSINCVYLYRWFVWRLKLSEIEIFQIDLPIYRQSFSQGPVLGPQTGLLLAKHLYLPIAHPVKGLTCTKLWERSMRPFAAKIKDSCLTQQFCLQKTTWFSWHFSSSIQCLP